MVPSFNLYGLRVALRKESVDRNDTEVGIPNTNTRSLSARRAWIEIVVPSLVVVWSSGRSPQGERG